MNIASWLERAARQHGDAPAIAVGKNHAATYSEVARRAAALASSLASAGLRSGDRLVIASKNHTSYLEVLFAAWWGGFVAVPINAKLHLREIAWIVEHSGARALFVSSDIASCHGADASSPMVVTTTVGSSHYEAMLAGEPSQIVPKTGDDLAWLFYTSGTTGRPKGAMLTHRNLIAMSLAHIVDLERAEPGDVLIHCAPMSHASGMLALPHVCQGGVNVIPESGGFDPTELFDLVAHWRRASFFAAPTMLRRLVDSAEPCDADAIRTVLWGGAPMHASDAARAITRFGPKLTQIYGQGETPLTITGLCKGALPDSQHPSWGHRLASAGTARSVVEIAIADADGSLLAVDQVGEVIVRGDTVMAGYWQDEGATHEALRGGWLHTGDIGSLDSHGYLTLLDRSKDMIISGGSNIYPREVEEVLMSHPGVLEVSVIGRPDAEWGEVVIAYVVGEVTAADLEKLCLRNIGRFKRPKEYVFMQSLPKNNYGKVLKSALREHDHKLALDSANRPSDTRKAVK